MHSQDRPLFNAHVGRHTARCAQVLDQLSFPIQNPKSHSCCFGLARISYGMIGAMTDERRINLRQHMGVAFA